ncbi:hypothetical protein Vafri_15082, partial [Volvox africanus]
MASFALPYGSGSKASIVTRRLVTSFVPHPHPTQISSWPIVRGSFHIAAAAAVSAPLIDSAFTTGRSHPYGTFSIAEEGGSNSTGAYTPIRSYSRSYSRSYNRSYSRSYNRSYNRSYSRSSSILFEAVPPQLTRSFPRDLHAALTPREMGFRMPGEYERHAGTWMAFPYDPYLWRDEARPAQQQQAAIARAISQFEPVWVLADPQVYSLARDYFRVVSGVDVIQMPTNDVWVRDWGPTVRLYDCACVRTEKF